MNANEILIAASKLSLDEQKQLNRDLVANINRSMRLRSAAASADFNIGDKIRFDGKTRGIVEGVIEGFSGAGNLKVKQTNSTHRSIAGTPWKVAASVCKKI